MTSGPPGRLTVAGRRERRKARTRRALLESALGLFAEHGIYDTRLEDITEAADLGKGAFYNYFSSKTDLVSALLTEAVDQLLDDCRDAAPGATSPRERVAALLRAHDTFFRRHRAYFLLLHQARGILMRQQEQDAVLARVFRHYLTELGRLLVPPGSGAAMSPAARTDLAAAVAGAVSGYRSFDAAAGLAPQPHTLESFIVGGLQAALRK